MRTPTVIPPAVTRPSGTVEAPATRALRDLEAATRVTKYARALALALVAALALSGCASVESVKQEKGQGIKRTFRYSGDAVFQALITVGARRKLELVEQDRAGGLIVFSSGASLTSLGERIAVFLTRASDRSTAVELVAKPVGGAVTFPPDWAGILYGDLEHELALQKLK